jgi:uncharacterized membrane protein YgdD (TMEM256/DUF423 family)
MRKRFLRIGAFLGFVSVAFGAFGAHSLKSMLQPDQLATFHTAVEYQFYHTLAILLVAVLMHFGRKNLLVYAGTFFVTGIAFFSGSLYILSIGSILKLNLGMIGPITPLGGLCLILGWICLLLSTFTDYDRKYKEEGEK